MYSLKKFKHLDNNYMLVQLDDKVKNNFLSSFLIGIDNKFLKLDTADLNESTDYYKNKLNDKVVKKFAGKKFNKLNKKHLTYLADLCKMNLVIFDLDKLDLKFSTDLNKKNKTVYLFKHGKKEYLLMKQNMRGMVSKLPVGIYEQFGGMPGGSTVFNPNWPDSDPLLLKKTAEPATTVAAAPALKASTEEAAEADRENMMRSDMYKLMLNLGEWDDWEEDNEGDNNSSKGNNTNDDYVIYYEGGMSPKNITNLYFNQDDILTKQFSLNDTKHDFFKYRIMNDLASLYPNLNFPGGIDENDYINNVLGLPLKGEIISVLYSDVKGKKQLEKFVTDNAEFFENMPTKYLYDMGNLMKVAETQVMKRVQNLATIIDGQGGLELNQKDYIFIDDYKDLTNKNYKDIYEEIFKENGIPEDIINIINIDYNINNNNNVRRFHIKVNDNIPIVFNIDKSNAFTINSIKKKINEYKSNKDKIIDYISNKNKDQFDEFFDQLKENYDQLSYDNIIKILLTFKLIGDRGQALSVKELNKNNENEICLLLSNDRMCVSYAMMKHIPVMYYSPSKKKIFLYKPKEIFKFKLSDNINYEDNKLIIDSLQFKLYKKVYEVLELTLNDVQQILSEATNEKTIKIIVKNVITDLLFIATTEEIEKIIKDNKEQEASDIRNIDDDTMEDVLYNTKYGIVTKSSMEKIVDSTNVKQENINKIKNVNIFNDVMNGILQEVVVLYLKDGYKMPLSYNYNNENSLKILKILIGHIKGKLTGAGPNDKEYSTNFMKRFKILLREKCLSAAHSNLEKFIKGDKDIIEKFENAFELDDSNLDGEEKLNGVVFNSEINKVNKSYKNFNDYFVKLCGLRGIKRKNPNT